ncbi:MAG TPA: hypothetical protein VF796_06875 [Humisphaera sp.]
MPDVPHEPGEILRAAGRQSAARAAHLDALGDDLARAGPRSLRPADVIEGLDLLARAAAALRAVSGAAASGESVAGGTAGRSEPKEEDHG